MPSIGIARSLHSYHHFLLWKTFFAGLGWEVVLSGPVDKEIVWEGVRLAPAELCLPVKIFLGQVATLWERVDFIFVPRLVCRRLKRDFYFGCPKAIALPDLVRAIFPQKGRILELVIDQQLHSEEEGFVRCAKVLGVDRQRARTAFRQAKWAEAKAEELMSQGVSPPDCFHPLPLSFRLGTVRERIGVVGHPYLIYDEHISLNLLKLIGELEVEPVVPLVSSEMLRQEVERGRSPNWYYELELIVGARQLLNGYKVRGILLVSSFACGTAPVVNELIRREVAIQSGVPVLTLLFDEHSAEAGLRTRLESFVDLIRGRK